jgi:hypothetical protein
MVADLKIIRDIENALCKALCLALGNTKQKEPQLVANIVFYIPKIINSLNIAQIKSGGVFVHQKPIVQYKGAKKGCEIGDLLLLRTEKKNNGTSSHSAILLQAKKNKTNQGFSVKLDKVQHDLYAKWPAFVYNKAGKKFNGEKRKIAGLDLYNASKYLLLNFPFAMLENPCFLYNNEYTFPIWQHCHFCHRYACIMTAYPTQPELSNYRCFIMELIDFILGNAGKAYEDSDSDNSLGWNRVISDLIKITKDSVSTYLGNLGKTQSRQQGIICFLTGDSTFFSEEVSEESEQFSINEPPNISNVSENANEEGGYGIPIIEFIVESENRE